MRRIIPWITLLLLGPSVLQAAAPGSLALPIDKTALDNLEPLLRSLIIEAVPNPLHEDNSHWGGQREVVKGVKWKKKGIVLRPEIMKGLENDGIWWKVRASAPLLANTLKLDLSDPVQTGPGKITFQVLLGFQCEIQYDRQNWKGGVRLVSTSAKAKMYIWLRMQIAVETRLEPTGKLLPDAVIQMRVAGARADYTGLTIEHVGGLGGDAAELFGEALIESVKAIKPSLERKLLERANAAIVKAGKTREVRLSLAKWLGL